MRTGTAAWWLPEEGHKDFIETVVKRTVFNAVCVCEFITWLPILMGGPLGPPAKRGDMKDCKDSFINKTRRHDSPATPDAVKQFV